MMYKAETWTSKKKDENALERTTMRMFRWTLGVALIDRVKSVDIRRKLVVLSILKDQRKDKIKI